MGMHPNPSEIADIIFGHQLLDIRPKKNLSLDPGLGLGSGPKPKLKPKPKPKLKTKRDQDSEFDSIHFGI
jgi:hypothetical protein